LNGENSYTAIVARQKLERDEIIDNEKARLRDLKAAAKARIAAKKPDS